MIACVDSKQFAWLGTRPATRQVIEESARSVAPFSHADTSIPGAQNITGIYKDGYHVAIIPGGIAEMFIISETEEKIYLKARKGFVKAAIQEVSYRTAASLCAHM
jgi:hypothetical protein